MNIFQQVAFHFPLNLEVKWLPINAWIPKNADAFSSPILSPTSLESIFFKLFTFSVNDNSYKHLRRRIILTVTSLERNRKLMYEYYVLCIFFSIFVKNIIVGGNDSSTCVRPYIQKYEQTNISNSTACSEIPFSKSSYQIKTTQLIFKANQLTSFFMIRVLTWRYFRTDYNYSNWNGTEVGFACRVKKDFFF